MTALPSDEGLPQLAQAFAPENAADICRAAGLAPERSARIEIELMKHVPGQRATIVYTIRNRAETERRLVGKLYRSKRRAERMRRWLSELSTSVFREGELRVPTPVGFVDELHMVLHNYVDAVDLRHALNDGSAFALSASWLVRLHEAPPLDELRVRTVEHEITKAIHWLDQVTGHTSMATQARLAAARDRLFTLLADPPRTNLTTIHRDYYYANVLWDGHSLCVIDLDQLRIGDPALDVAHFAAHLDVLAYRQTGDIAAYREQSATFVGAYRPALGAPPVADRLPIYRAYTFLKLAATEVTREREGWRDATEAMARAACGELDA